MPLGDVEGKENVSYEDRRGGKGARALSEQATGKEKNGTRQVLLWLQHRKPLSSSPASWSGCRQQGGGRLSDVRHRALSLGMEGWFSSQGPIGSGLFCCWRRGCVEVNRQGASHRCLLAARKGEARMMAGGERRGKHREKSS